MGLQRHLVLGLTWLSIVPWAVSQDVRSVNNVPGRVESNAQQFTHWLEKQGYEVLRGYFKLYTTADCDLSYKVMHTCYGNNPAAPYVIPIVPPWPDEWVDPAIIGALGKTVDGYDATYRLDPHEALDILAQMPPPAAFLSEKTYLFTRSGDPTLFGMFVAGIRDYIAQGNKRGPDTSQLLRPRILTFTQP